MRTPIAAPMARSLLRTAIADALALSARAALADTAEAASERQVIPARPLLEKRKLIDR